MPLEGVMCLQPLEPAFGRSDPPALVSGRYAQPDQRRDAVDIAGLLRVSDHQLGVPVRLAPVRCPRQQAGHEIGLGSRQLGSEQFPEEVVVAVPLAGTVQRHQEQVGARQRLKRRGRSGLLENRVAQRPRQPLQHGRSREEAVLVRGDLGKQLRPQVLRYQDVAAGEAGGRRLGLGPARPDRERREVEARAPALGVLSELSDLGLRQLHAGGPQQLVRLRAIQTQVLDPELQLQPPRPQRPKR